MALAYLALMVAWPVLAVLRRSLTGVGAGRLAEIVSSTGFWSVVGFTLWQALVSATVTLVVGIPAAHVLSRHRFIGRRLVRTLVVVPFVMPTLVVAAAFDVVFGSREGLAPVVAAHVFFNLAVVVRLVGGRWAALGGRPSEAAAVLGADPRRTWRTITLPALAPVVMAGFLVTFLFSFTSFGVIRVLGGLRMATIETEIYRHAVLRQQFDVAAVLACVQLVVVAGLSLGAGLIQRRHTTSSTQAAARPQPVDGLGRRLYVSGVLAALALIHGVPMLVLVERSLKVGPGYGFDHYRGLVDRVDLLPTSGLGAIVNSLQFATVAAIVAAVVAVLATAAIMAGGRLGRALEAAVFVPLGVSAVTLGFGYLVGFALFDLRRSWWLVPLAHSVVGLPFVLASVVPAGRSVGPSLVEAASTLGASARQVVSTIYWPLVRPALAVGVAFAATVSLGEFGATSFLARGDQTFTAPLAIFRLLGTPGGSLRGQAMALSVVIGGVVAAVAFTIESRRPGRVGVL